MSTKYTEDQNRAIYEENSNIYIFTEQSFKDSNLKRIGLKPLMFEINKRI